MSCSARLSLPIRLRTGTSLSSTHSKVSQSQTRHASTARRHRKLLNLPPAPHAGGAPPTSGTSASTASTAQAGAVPAAIRDTLPRFGTSGRSRMPKSALGQQILAAGDRVVYAPPSSTPSAHHTPLKFLPKDDPRRAHLERIAQLKQANLAAANEAGGRGSGGETLPPPVDKKLYPKRYHLTAESIEEIRRLRRSDEEKWTRNKLAEKFDCSPMLVSLVVPASEEKRAKFHLERKARAAAWGPKRRKAMADRVKRFEMWTRDE